VAQGGVAPGDTATTEIINAEVEGLITANTEIKGVEENIAGVD